MSFDNFVALSGTGNYPLAQLIVNTVSRLSRTRIKFLHIDLDDFPDDEPDFRIPQYKSIEGKNILLFQSIYYNSKYDLRDQFTTIAWAAKNQYKAKSVIGILPFMCFRRQDHPEIEAEIHRNRMFVEELKFKGLIFTDALRMKAVSKYFDPGVVELKALLAGNDVLLLPSEIPKAIDQIKNAMAWFAAEEVCRMFEK